MQRVIATSALFALTLVGQDTQFHTESRVVLVPVTVVGEKGRAVDGLTAADFTLLDNNSPQQITVDPAGTGVAPISLLIAVQSNDISAAALTKVRRIGSLIQPLILGEQGEAAVLTFDDEVLWRQDFTGDTDSISSALAGIQPGEQERGRMLDALLEASKAMSKRRGRKIVLMVSESRDRGSKTKLDAAVHAVQEAGIAVYAARYSAWATPFTVKQTELPPPPAPNLSAIFTEPARLGTANTVRVLAQATGGAEFGFLTRHSLETAIEKFAAEVHSQYILSFRPRSSEPGLHKLDVKVLNHDGVRVRWRQAYWVE